MPPAHPQKSQLIAFGQGKLAAEELSQVESHLGVCRECCETLLDLKDDTFVGLVRIAKPEVVPEPASVGTDPGAGSSEGVRKPLPEATVVAQAGETVSADELPVELAEHPRYRIVELIGRGGMGNVYRAEHRLMNRAVAIKLINSQLVQHPQAVERFRREVQAAAKLSHPNIVAAYDAEQAGNAHFLVMEFVEGTDLASVVKQRGPLSVAKACECIRQAAVGLQHAHERGMVHRDIKPHNLMLAASGQVRILDFGLTGFAEAAFGGPAEGNPKRERGPAVENNPDPETPRAPALAHASGYMATAAHLTAMGSVMGTPDYMAPEQAADAHSADIRADIYSLGCTLHFLLTGKPPFEADNVIAKLKAHAEQSPPELTTLRSDVPAKLSKVITRMMAKNPAERFQTPAAVAEALAPFSQSAQAPPRRRTLRTLLATTAAILLAGVIFITTDKGRVEIRSERDDVELVIRQNGAEIKAIDLQTGTQVIWLPSGEYNVVLRDGNDYINLEKNGFKLSRWGKEIVTVKREAAAVESPSSDRDRLQGKWTLLSMQVGQRKFDQKELAGQATMELTFAGDNFNLKRIALAGDRVPVGTVMRPAAMEGQFFLDTTKSPKRITVMVPKDNLNSLLGIYRLDGDKLTLCCIENPDSTDYPTEFATKSGSRAVLYEFQREATSVSKIAESASQSMTALRDFVEVTAYLNNPLNNRGGSVPVALLGQNGRVAFRFGNWRVVFEGIVCDPKATILGFSNFNVPQPGTRGEGTVDFGAGKQLPGVLIKFKFANDTNEISINNHRFKLKGKATRLEFDDKAYDATNSVQTILVARDGSTRVAENAAAQKQSPAPNLPAGAMSETVQLGFNGGFELTKSGLPVTWFFYTPRTVPNADFDIVMDTTDFKEGEQSLKIVVRKCESTGGRLSPGFFNEFHVENHNPPGPFETKPGETYKISFWAKNAGSEFVFKARGVSALEGDKGVVIRSKETINEWRRFECTYTIPPQMWLRLELNVVQPGTFGIDDLQIVRVNEEDN